MDPRRLIPKTDKLLALPEVRKATESLSLLVVKDLIKATQARARRGEIAPDQVEPELLQALNAKNSSSLNAVINATGVIIHTNLGRAPLTDAAKQAIQAAAGYVDLEFDLASGTRGRRASGLRAALLTACPAAEDALVVNNGASALALAVATFAGYKFSEAELQAEVESAVLSRPELLLSRGEIIEIGAGFRLLEMMQATGAKIKEIGSTNRTHLADYEQAISKNTAGILKIHASNYVMGGFTAEARIRELAELAKQHSLPLIVDIGSGLINPEIQLPAEPTITAALEAGADLVICSGDKLIGGPQAGIIFGKSEWIARVSRHPLARAFRADKLQIAALEATLSGPPALALQYLRVTAEELQGRSERFVAKVPSGINAEVVEHAGRVGGGGGAEVPLAGFAVSVDEGWAHRLRLLDTPIITTVKDGRCLIDLRCVSEAEEAQILQALTSQALEA